MRLSSRPGVEPYHPMRRPAPLSPRRSHAQPLSARRDRVAEAFGWDVVDRHEVAAGGMGMATRGSYGREGSLDSSALC